MIKRKLRENKYPIYMSLLAVIILFLVLAIYHFVRVEEVTTFATSYDNLQVFIKHSNDTERINSWKSEDGIYYFFLPAYVDDESVLTFGNLNQRDKICIEEKVCTADTNLSEFIKWEQPYETQLCIDGEQLSNEVMVFLKSGSLSSLSIQTESGSTEAIHEDKEVKEKATLVVKDENGEIKYNNQIEYIKTRGRSSFFDMDKKSYQIKLYKKSGLLGMDKAEKWILLANYVDDSLMRNQFVYHFAEQYTDIPSIQGVFVDLYMNGDYLGNYYLCEKVEVAKNRLEITDLDKLNEAANVSDALTAGEQYVSEDGSIRAVSGGISPQNISGGYLVEAMSSTEYDLVRSGFKTNHGMAFEIISPKNATVEEAEYIRNLFNEMEEAIYHPDGINPDTGKHFSEYIDMESWGTKYLLEETFHDPDATAASAFFYKEADDSLIYAGPMWDYDRALGSYGVGQYSIDLPEGIGYYSVYASVLMQQDEFESYVKERFQTLICPYVETQAREDVYKWVRELEASAGMNKIRWPGARGYYDTLEANADYILYFLDHRMEYLENVWLKNEIYHTVSFLDYYGNEIDKYIVKHGEYLQQVPEINTYVAIFNGWESVATGTKLDMRLPVLEDAVYQSQWIDVSVLLENGLGMADMSMEDVDIDTLEALVEYVKEHQGENTDEK